MNIKITYTVPLSLYYTWYSKHLSSWWILKVSLLTILHSVRRSESLWRSERRPRLPVRRRRDSLNINLDWTLIYQFYKFTQKGWDFNNDLKLLKLDLILIGWVWSFPVNKVFKWYDLLNNLVKKKNCCYNCCKKNLKCFKRWLNNIRTVVSEV